MPSSFADFVIDWETLVANVKASAADVPGVSLYLEPMEQLLTEAKEMAAQLARRKGVKQAESQQRKALMLKGRKQAARVRAVLKAHFGIDNERLVEFGARPVRPRSGKVPQEVPKTPPPLVEDEPEKGKEEAPRNPAAS